MNTPTHAVVVGASVAGLLSARVLSSHFDQVTLIERDLLTDQVGARKGVPQGQHTHGLLAGGLRAMADLFPGLEAELTQAGAVSSDLIGDTVTVQGGVRRPRVHSGIGLLCLSRPLLEATIRRRVLALPNVTLCDGLSFLGYTLSADGQATVGVQCQTGSGEELQLPAQLVVDATGRGSRTPAWLESHGFAAPAETQLPINLRYVTREYARQPGDLGGANAFAVLPQPPHEYTLGSAAAVEGDRWLVMQGGWLGHHPPQDEAGFLSFAAGLAAPEFHAFLSTARPLSGFSTYTFKANVRRHYERLTRFPAGLLVVGDAWCSFNPVYGQGMTVAALEALALERVLAGRRGSTPLGLTYFKAARRIVELAWSMAANADLAYPEVPGPRPALIKAMNWYMGHFQRASLHDSSLATALFEVAHLLRPPSALVSPGTLLRVSRAARQHRTEQAALSVPA
ncbi:FAD-dependent monooxygenase [Deinococcus sp. HMF7604]|uniref:FAD-dependent oxidoreductase n=1 Tax=Deinococcus betulae TaxID=2873312 RepID=UPI001CCEB7F3|nr:FAD-dependent monooxygenase [Deinococcus betulae]MBZ9749853.1 FAD-dependent monooxygenase [Deinococcus betulae]